MVAVNKLNERLNEAIAHHQAGRVDRAEAIYRQLAPTARNATVFHLWGMATEQLGRLDEAIRLYTQASRLDPTAVQNGIRLANVLVATARVAEAEAVLRRLTQTLPKSPDAWNALGHILKLRGNLADAIACSQRALELNPRFVAGWCELGLTLGSAGRNTDALAQFEKALELQPTFAAARYGRAQSLHKTYRLREAIAEYDAFLKADPGNLEAHSFRLFALANADWISREQVFAEHVAYGRLVGAEVPPSAGRDLAPDRRLRVGILSPDLRTHACAYFLLPLLRHLDRAQFEVYLYHDHFAEDPMSAQLRQYAAKWRNFVGQAHGTVERTIRADAPDILIDLSGHLGSSLRLPVFARRVAPVQITYLGYPDTTGVPAMDYRFVDAITDPVGEADRFATEKLVRFAPTAWAYQPPEDSPPVAPVPCATSATVTFGCFNSPTKFTDRLLATWARLLAEVPGSRLLLKGRDFQEPSVYDGMRRRMQAAGLDPDRVVLLPKAPGIAEHLAQYAQMDISLDTFHYTGTTTTCESLWMGRPVVTLAGERHAARVSASLLTAQGRPEWIARTEDDYVRIARELVSDRAALAATSAGLRTRLVQSPIMDHAGQSARFAAALRQCWVEKTKS